MKALFIVMSLMVSICTTASANVTLKCTVDGQTEQTVSAVMTGSSHVYADGTRYWYANLKKTTLVSPMDSTKFQLVAFAETIVPKDSTPEAQEKIRIGAWLSDTSKEIPNCNTPTDPCYVRASAFTQKGEDLTVEMFTGNTMSVTCKIVKD